MGISSKPKPPKSKSLKKAIPAKSKVQKNVKNELVKSIKTSDNVKTSKKAAKVNKIKETAKQLIELKQEDEVDCAGVEIKPNVSDSNVKKAVGVLRQLVEINAKEKKNNLFDEDQSIMLQLECIKIPQCPPRKLRFKLPHWLLSDSAEVCLFVRDLKKGKRVDHEPTVEHYEDLLRAKGITTVKSVIPIRQVRVEFDQMELKRQLLTRFDCFLVDGRVSGLLTHKLGNTFSKKKRWPIPIRMDAKDLKAEIDGALHKTAMNLHSDGNTYTVRVANNNQTEKQICANVQSILLQLAKQFPGGWNNVRSVHLKYPLSMAIPIYCTLRNKNEVERPVIQPLHANESVEDELSTVLDGRVIVHSDGTVILKRDAEDDAEMSDEEVPKKKLKTDTKKAGKSNKPQPDDEIDAESDEDDSGDGSEDSDE